MEKYLGQTRNSNKLSHADIPLLISPISIIRAGSYADDGILSNRSSVGYYYYNYLNNGGAFYIAFANYRLENTRYYYATGRTLRCLAR